MNKLKKKAISEMSEIKKKLQDKEYDAYMLAEEHPFFNVLFDEMYNESGSIRKDSEKVAVEQFGNYRFMDRQLKLFCNDFWYRFFVLSGTHVDMEESGLEDIYKVFNRALYINYIRYIAGKLGFDVVRDDRVP